MRAEAVAESAVGRSDGIDSISRAWIDGLRARGGRRTQKLAELRDLMTRAARQELARRRHWPNAVGGKDLDDLAEEIASDALFTVITRLESYRGDARFTTWAYAFVIKTASAKLARQARRPVAVTMEDHAWERLPDRLSVDPYSSVEVRDLLRALRRGVERALTERQRQVFIAVALNDTPIDEVAVELGSNRNAIYKTLFDARRKLRAHLEAAGHLSAIPRDGPVGEADNP
jgi:RNA polymerase sigma-70 factor (ECF subfamily)